MGTCREDAQHVARERAVATIVIAEPNHVPCLYGRAGAWLVAAVTATVRYRIFQCVFAISTLKIVQFPELYHLGYYRKVNSPSQ